MKRTAIALSLIVALLVSSVAGLVLVKAEAKIIVVPDDYPTISLAIENASAGDAILVKKGTYQETSIYLNKSLSLIGEDIDETVLNLDSPLVQTNILRNWLWIPSPAITINANDVKLQDFTINMPKDAYGYGLAIYAIGDRIDIICNQVANRSFYLRGTSLNINDNSIGSTLEVVGSNQTIANNSIQGYLKIQGSFSKITGNIIQEDMNLNGSLNLIAGNSVKTISLEYSNSNVIYNDSFKSLVLESRWLGCDANLITKNKVTGTGLVNDGIRLHYGSNNIISANTIRNCEHGLTLGNPSVVTKNDCYLNNFINNSDNVNCYGDSNWIANHFDNGAKGNYYDDYRGSDKDGDGIGDSPYSVKEIHWDEDLKRDVTVVYFQDNYPLMSPFDIDYASIELPDWASALLNPSTEPQPSEPFSTLSVVAVSVAAVAVVVAVYYKKRKRKD